MKTLSSTELRANLSAVMDRVNDDHEPVIVTRAGGSPVAMVRLEDWSRLDETTYLTASPANKAALDKAMKAKGYFLISQDTSGEQGAIVSDYTFLKQ